MRAMTRSAPMLNTAVTGRSSASGIWVAPSSPIVWPTKPSTAGSTGILRYVTMP